MPTVSTAPTASVAPVAAFRPIEPPQVDLSSCDLEPIRVPGSIQPHGRLLVLQPDSLALVAWSENWPAAQLAAAQDTLGQLRLPALQPGASPVSLGAVQVGAEVFDAAAHRNARHLIVEFERRPSIRWAASSCRTCSRPAPWPASPHWPRAR
jgi:chemotaxis family two-component system sensor kinase Cph1